MAAKRRGLGRGLDALLADSNPSENNEIIESAPPSREKLKEIPLELLQRGKYQPRRDMHPEALEELAASIRVQGVMQPIVVRSIDEQRFEIIAGERRWRAAQLAGLESIPALVREVADQAAIAMALIENIQRENLNAIEESRALIRLQEEFDLTQQQVSDAVGKSRAAVANLMRLSSLEDEVQIMLEHGDLEMGHGRALLGLSGIAQVNAARTVVGKGMTVRQTEDLVRKLQQPPASKTNPIQANADIRHLEEKLSQQVGAEVMIQHSSAGKGKLVFKYNSLDELEGILERIH